jgi:acyl-CoA synthetase (AMP-forming)/AMP-acid ligase II
MVSHANLIQNSSYIGRAFAISSETISVTWLPVFHDMGLTNGIVQPLFAGRQCILMPPQAVLQRPVRWLRAIAHYRATISGGPNFIYDLCARKVGPKERDGLDLSSWEVAYDGAEPVRAESLRAFASAFASCGFRSRSFYPCYGLAEATLIVSGGLMRDEPVVCTARVDALEYNGIVEASPSETNARTLVGCGKAMPGTRIVIADPETMVACPPNEVGEIWVSGPSVTRGYWGLPDENARVFGAHLKDTGEGPFLRTGDLGFLKDGELFVTGRLKDLIIIAGRNLYPNDIEWTVEQSHAALRSGCSAAFSVEITDGERLIVAAEVERRYAQEAESAPIDTMDPSLSGGPNDALVRGIRRAVAEEHDVRVHEVVLLKSGSIPRTPSGKIQRRLCEARFRDGTLERCVRTT